MEHKVLAQCDTCKTVQYVEDTQLDPCRSCSNRDLSEIR